VVITGNTGKLCVLNIVSCCSLLETLKLLAIIRGSYNNSNNSSSNNINNNNDVNNSWNNKRGKIIG